MNVFCYNYFALVLWLFLYEDSIHMSNLPVSFWCCQSNQATVSLEILDELACLAEKATFGSFLDPECHIPHKSGTFLSKVLPHVGRVLASVTILVNNGVPLLVVLLLPLAVELAGGLNWGTLGNLSRTGGCEWLAKPEMLAPLYLDGRIVEGDFLGKYGFDFLRW